MADDILDRGGRRRRRSVRTTFAGVRAMSGVVRAGRPPAASNFACRREHLLQPLADEPAPANRAGEQIGMVTVVDLAVHKLCQLVRLPTAWNMLRHLLLSRHGRAGGQHFADANDTEVRRRIVDRLRPGRQAQ